MVRPRGSRPFHVSFEAQEKAEMGNGSWQRLGFNNLKRRLMFWYKSRSEPMVNGPVRRSDHRVYGHIQSSLAAENLMLSLAAHGYESCPMGGIDKRGIGKLLGIPSTAEVTMVIGAGTGAPQGLFSARVRLPISDLVQEI